MNTITIVTTDIVNAPAESAWELLSTYANDPLWRHGVSRMEQDPPGGVVDGARTEERLRMLGRTMNNIAVVSDVVPGHSFAWRVSEGVDARGTRAVEAIDENTCRITIAKEVSLTGADRLLRPIVALALRRLENADTARAKSLIEQRWMLSKAASGT